MKNCMTAERCDNCKLSITLKSQLDMGKVKYRENYIWDQVNFTYAYDSAIDELIIEKNMIGLIYFDSESEARHGLEVMQKSGFYDKFKECLKEEMFPEMKNIERNFWESIWASRGGRRGAY